MYTASNSILVTKLERQFLVYQRNHYLLITEALLLHYQTQTDFFRLGGTLMKLRRVSEFFLLIAMFVLPLSACLPKEPMQEVNWELQGAWISEDGKVIGSNELSIRGSVPVEYDGANSKQAELNFTWPEALNYMNYGTEMYSVRSNSKGNATDTCPFYVFGYASYYEPALKKPIPLNFVIFPEEQFAVFVVSEYDRYFVASTDPNADLKALLELCKEQVMSEDSEV